MTYEDMAKSIPLLIKYTPEGEGTWFEADHDIIYSGIASDVEMTPEDESTLEALGWFKDDAGVWACYT